MGFRSRLASLDGREEEQQHCPSVFHQIGSLVVHTQSPRILQNGLFWCGGETPQLPASNPLPGFFKLLGALGVWSEVEGWAALQGPVHNETHATHPKSILRRSTCHPLRRLESTACENCSLIRRNKEANLNTLDPGCWSMYLYQSDQVADLRDHRRTVCMAVG
jgi:hypothetical protein